MKYVYAPAIILALVSKKQNNQVEVAERERKAHFRREGAALHGEREKEQKSIGY